jgi:hypothetical protein
MVKSTSCESYLLITDDVFLSGKCLTNQWSLKYILKWTEIGYIVTHSQRAKDILMLQSWKQWPHFTHKFQENLDFSQCFTTFF